MMKKNINKQIFKDLFLSYSIIFSKKLYNSNQNVNDEIVKHINDALIELKKGINRNPNEIVHIVEKILNLINNKKVKDFL